jgi:hypothetical protein
MDFYPEHNSLEIDLREELHAMLFGRIDLVPQGRPILLYRMTDQTCQACWNPLTKGSSRPQCPYCQGLGYMYYETLETMILVAGMSPAFKPNTLNSGYPMAGYGYTDTSKATAFCEYTVYPNYERYTLEQHTNYDILYELKVEPQGGILTPIIKTAKWKVLEVTPVFGDFGRVEYFELSLEKSNVS